MNIDNDRKAALEAVVKGAQQRNKDQRARNEEKSKSRQKKAQFAKNLRGLGAERHVPRVTIQRLEQLWRELLDTLSPGTVIGRWYIQDGDRLKGGKEVGLCTKLVQKYSEPIIESYFRYVSANWSGIRERFPKSPVVPTIGWLFVMSESLVPEAQQPEAEETSPAHEELKKWFREHPTETSPPEELLARIPLNFKGG